MPDEKLGKYEVRGTLGKGAMGTVYDGWDPVIARRVAIKTVRLPEASDEEAQHELARFKREAQAAGRLNHPNIVGVFDYGETAEVAYIIMEFVDGHTLKSLLDNSERVPIGEIGRIMNDLLEGLQYSHDSGVVHRDIKPANIMLTQQGRAKIADFGIARIESSSMTQAGTIMGTPAYMSPEQFMGQTVDLRTDLYSTGVMLYQLLTGERPFDGSMTAIMHKVLNTVPPKPSELSVVSPPPLDGVVARAMAKRPPDRFPSASAMADALRTAIAAPVDLLAPPDDDPIEATIRAIGPGTLAPSAAKPRPPEPAKIASPPPAKRGGAGLMIGIGVAAVVAIGGGAYFVFAPKPAGDTTAVATASGPTTLPTVTSPATPPAAAQAATPIAPPATAQAATPSANPLPPATTITATPPPVATAATPTPTRPAATQALPPATTVTAEPPPPAISTTPSATPPSRPVAPSLPPQTTATASPPPPLTTGTAPQSLPPPRPATTTTATPPPATVSTGAAPGPVAQPGPSAATPVPPSQTIVATAPPAPAPTTATPGTASPSTTNPATPPPAVTATAPPPAAPTQTAPTMAMVVPSAATIRQLVGSAVASAPCSIVTSEVSDVNSAITLTGIAGNAAAAALHQAIDGVAPSSTMNWHVGGFDGPYCRALDVLRVVAANGSGLAVALNKSRLVDHDLLTTYITMPDFPAHILIDYLSSDGSVAHLVPTTADVGDHSYPDQTYPARSVRTFGEPVGKYEGLRVGPPFGTDMMIVTASSVQLLTQRKEQGEDDSKTYLGELQIAIDNARRRGARVTARAVLLEIRAKP